MAKNQFTTQLEDDRAQFDAALDNVNTIADQTQQAAHDNRTQTVFGDDGRAVTQQWDAKSGGWNTVNDYANEYSMLDQLTGLSHQTMNEWASDNAVHDERNLYNEAQLGMANLGNSMETLTRDTLPWAQEQAAQSLGFSSAQHYSDALAQLLSGVLSGPEGMSGLSDHERDMYDRMGHQNQVMMQQDMNRHLDTVNAGGSTMRFLAAADEARLSMSSARLQHEYATMQADFERRMIQHEQNTENYMMMVQAGMATQEMYVEAVKADAVNAFQSYAQSAGMLMEQRSLDLEAQRLHAETIYQSINASIGISDHAMNVTNELYQQHMAPYMDQLSAAVTQLEAENTRYGTTAAQWMHREEQISREQQERRSRRNRGIFGALKVAAGFAAMFIPGGQVVGVMMMGSGAGLVGTSL